MFGTVLVQAQTGLSPEWDRGFDEEFAELISSDPDLVQAEFDALVGACWNQPPATPPPSPPVPASSADGPTPARPPAGSEEIVDQAADQQRSPP